MSAWWPHPDILAVFKRFVLVTRGCDPVEAELAKERQENLFDQIVFAAGIEERREVVPTLNLCWR
jgi:hypothetical protein